MEALFIDEHDEHFDIQSITYILIHNNGVVVIMTTIC